MIALFLVGPPGVGKTTIARDLLCRLASADTVFMQPNPKWTVAVGAYAAAGHYTGSMFDGADTVPYAGASTALDSLVANLAVWHPRLVLFDGDRFSHESALLRVRAAMRTKCVLLEADEATLDARRRLRGSNQNPSWIAGRATKSSRFFEKFSCIDRMRLRCEDTQSTLSEAVASWLDLRAWNYESERKGDQ